MINHELERIQVANIIMGYSQYIADTTSWFHSSIGSIHKIVDVTMINKDDEIEIDEIFLRDIELTCVVYDNQYIQNPEMLMEKIETKKIALSHNKKGGLLQYAFIDPIIEVVSEEDKLIMIKGNLLGNWKNISSHFSDYDILKCDINKYFESETLKHIAQGVMNGGLVNKNVLEILIGKKTIDKIKIDDSINSKYLNNLDASKHKIFKAASSNNDILLIKGPPGTGKTKAITELVKHFIYEKNEKIILASRTHAALDNVIQNLSVTTSSENYTGLILEKSSYGDTNKEYANKDALLVRNIRSRLLDNIPKNGELFKLMKQDFGPNVSSKRFLSTPKNFSHPSLFAGTITSDKLERKMKTGYKFDESILIMDEVSKSTIIDVFRYGLYAKKIILVGDNMQLGPIPQREKDYKDYYDMLSEQEKSIYDQLFKESVFERLYEKDKNGLVFTNTYRSSNKILSLYNEMAYKNIIKSKAERRIPFEFKDSKTETKYIKMYSKADLILIDNKNAYHHVDKKQSERSKINLKEMDELLNNIRFLSANLKNREDKEVMIMFAYKDQYKMFFREYNSKIKYWEKRFKSFKSGTIDQLQGNEADIVFLCTTYANEKHTLPHTPKFKTLLQDVKRLNVALSRTRHKLVLLANIKCYSKSPIFYNNKKICTFESIFNKFEVKGNKNE